MQKKFDIIIVGAGHAGVEAALAASRMGCDVALVTCDANAMARMPCNPALGGLGKGHLVREIDALGGQMGLCGDATAIQFRRLNQRKGAAVRGTRVQSDKAKYSEAMARTVRAQARLTVIEGEIVDVLVDQYCVTGVKLANDVILDCRAVVLTTGTFLSGLIHIGETKQVGGRFGEAAAYQLSHALKAIGLQLGRLKTGTPARLDGNTIDYTKMELQPGDTPEPHLSCWSVWPDGKPPLPQVACHITYTNVQTHELIRDNLHRAPMYSGAIQCVGPRYCPSIEDKVVRFADRERHQIFVEPEGLDTISVYPNGISTSLPSDVQERLIRSIVGFENAKILKWGYAVEYDFSDPRQLTPSLQIRGLEGFFLAGQINGTTGYEEAAGQGLIAGINAVRYCREEEPLVLRRDQAYLGVMIDDLVTQGTNEPYRMFTSRAEYRLLLREDNADTRLTPIGREFGLIDDEKWDRFCHRQKQLERLETYLRTTKLSSENAALDARLIQAGTTLARAGTSLAELLLRPQVTLDLLRDAALIPDEYDAEPMIWEQAEIATKYQGYIEKQHLEAERLAKAEHQLLPSTLNYSTISGLSNELREKLVRHQPRSLGQASRIPGMTPAALSLLQVHLKTLQLRTGSSAVVS